MINCLERQLKLHATSEKLTVQPSGDKEQLDIDPQVYCTLGHLNLLLENYPKGITFQN